ncbi:MAG: cupin domain-containing protein [Rheinheimera sp.]|nr:cupin domain-containing protein [Rheinheimera sp.]
MSDPVTPVIVSTPLAVIAQDVTPRQKPSVYPPPFAAMMQGRQKRVLGDLFGLQNFGVNLTELAPGAMSALRHHHHTQDEFIYILEGTGDACHRCRRNLIKPRHVRRICRRQW